MTKFSGSEVGGRTWEVSPDLLCIFENDGRFSAVNPAWSATLGWRQDELVGTIYSDLLHPDDASGTLRTLEALLENVPVLRYDNRYRHKDGSWRWLSWVAVPEDGKFYCSARDVSEEKAQAAALAKQAAALSKRTAERDHLWTLAQDLLARADYSGMMSAVSPSWTNVLGWSETELLTRGYATFMHPDDRLPTIAAIEQMARTRQPARFENRIATSGGGWKSIEWTVSPEPDNANFIAVGRDLSAAKARETELEKAQEALRQSQKIEAVGQLTGGVAHDYNNLLTVIRGSVELLRRPDLPEERRIRYIDAIADTSSRATKLTNQLLAFARRQTLKPEVFDTVASIRAIVSMIETLTGPRVKIDASLDENPCWVHADRSQFDTALVNMAVNARDAMGGEGRLMIAVQSVSGIPAVRSHPQVAGPFVAVSLSDTGAGMPAALIEHIFEPFFTTKGVGEGTGLGLSQVFGFTKQSGGEVDVSSEEGRGTTFTLYLPRADAPTDSKPATALSDELIDGHGACVLVVEDNAEVGAFATQALTELGFHTVLANGAEDALAQLKDGPDRFHAVFSDVVMPGMNGVQLGQEIQRRHPALPVLLTSGYSDVMAQGGTHGFELLHKPYSLMELSHVLRRVLGSRRN